MAAGSVVSRSGKQEPGDVALDTQVVQRVALPLHVQTLQRALKLDRLFSQVESVFQGALDQHNHQQPKSTLADSLTSPSVLSLLSGSVNSLHCSRQTPVCNRRAYNFSNVTEERKWVQDLLLSNSDGSDSELSDSEQFQIVLELQYKRKKKWRKRLKRDPKLLRYKYFSSGLLTPKDPYPEHVKVIEEKLDIKDKRDKSDAFGGWSTQKENQRQELWGHIAKKEVPKTAKQFSMSRHIVATNNKKVAQLCQREVKKIAAKSQRASKEVSSVQPRARRLMREALIYWRRYERVEREQRKKAEKEATEQNKLNQEMMEAKRQQRKLNFLITQTELYAHFMAKKLTGEEDQSEQILSQLEDGPVQREVRPGVVVDIEDPEEYNSEAVKAQVMANVQSALQKQQNTQYGYDSVVDRDDPADLQESFDKNFSLATPMLMSDREVPQPTIFNGVLKAYQLKGMNWLANLYDQGINGILADEMGLGKTVQSIAFLSHLAEHQDTWGPFLIVSPASTLHNWQQEASRFVPKLKALPYWGSPHERKVIRKYWNQKLLCRENAPFHILITSYQLVVQDMKYFQRIKWQYMILDEAQAIKSSTSVRWKVLLSFNCRNRLLLTGTPIQNTMQELWALLHFIMPTMFDSHEEFNEWFSKDIESHAEKKSVLDEHQLSRLHLILKPFMLRRIKRDVEHEMAEKIEVHLSCELSTRQRCLYQGLRQKISVEQLLQSSSAHSSNSSRDSATSHLLNLVMQFRKVCNHPDLFERRNVESPISLSIPPYTVPRLLYYNVMMPSTDRNRLLTVRLGVHTAEHIHHSTIVDSGQSDSCWSFLRLIDVTPREASNVMLGSLTARFLVMLNLLEKVHLLYQQRYWGSTLSQSRSSATQLLLWPNFKTSCPSRSQSPVLTGLVFTNNTRPVYAHTVHKVFKAKHGTGTSAELTEISSTVTNPASNTDVNSSDIDIRPSKGSVMKSLPITARENDIDAPMAIEEGHRESNKVQVESVVKGSTLSGSGENGEPGLVNGSSIHQCSRKGEPAERDSRSSVEVPSVSQQTGESHSSSTSERPTHCDDLAVTCGHGSFSEYQCVLTDLPRFLVSHIPKVQIPISPVYCSDRSSEYLRQEWLSGGPSHLKQLFLHGAESVEERQSKVLDLFAPSQLAGLAALNLPNGWSHIHIPDKETMIFDSGKMVVLDKLLTKLKREGHRVLIYSQMTRVIDLLEEFMAYRRHRFIRLDGSSRISDRRDMVADFQSNSEIFAFLLSTRAGGLGINLTAADTVIFYDSDWNPTVDQQAMDRAHRLGQTKQVTVYRLIVRGTIEERILQRAKEKSEIQKMVISGSDFKPDTLKAKDMVSLLLHDDEMETRFLAKQAEKKVTTDQFQQGKKTKNSNKRKNVSNGMDTEPLRKKPNTSGFISATPSPLVFASRPDSVMSLASVTEPMNGDDTVDVVGSTDGSEVNLEISKPGSTPVRAKKQRGSSSRRGMAKGMKTIAPLGGRGRIQRTGKKPISGSAAASAGAIAGAIAASSAAYAAFGQIGYGISPSPSNSVAGSPGGQLLANTQGSSAQSSPRASPIPAAFVATSLITTPPSQKNNSKKLIT